MDVDVLVLGAGMVGISTALHLAARGRRVAVVDRSEPGRETSYGNAGFIQREAMEPYAFPRSWKKVAQVALHRGMDVRYHFRALPWLLPNLLRYWSASGTENHARAAAHYGTLIARCLDEHEVLIREAGAEDLVRREGYLSVFHHRLAWQRAVDAAARLHRRHGTLFESIDGEKMPGVEPALSAGLAGAVHWLEPWTVSDPGGLVERYAALLQRWGGDVLRGDANTLTRRGGAWIVSCDAGEICAPHVVVALGPWSSQLTQRLGYRLPLFVKRGYHRHYSGGAALRRPVLDVERGFVLSPMRQGLRLATGAELALLDSPATPIQLTHAEIAARSLTDLGEPVEHTPWLGNRPCTADMLPIVGPAPRHEGLWFNFGHGHQGFTLGPVTGRLLAELISGEPGFVASAPFRPDRFP